MHGNEMNDTIADHECGWMFVQRVYLIKFNHIRGCFATGYRYHGFHHMAIHIEARWACSMYRITATSSGSMDILPYVWRFKSWKDWIWIAMYEMHGNEMDDTISNHECGWMFVHRVYLIKFNHIRGWGRNRLPLPWVSPRGYSYWSPLGLFYEPHYGYFVWLDGYFSVRLAV